VAVNKSLLSAWSEAERLAADAEEVLFSKALNATHPCDYPSQQEVERARDLRRNAIELVHQVLADVQAAAELVALKTRPTPSTPASTAAYRGAETTGEGNERTQESAGPLGPGAARG
jgi:hypothetical protein